VVSVLYSVLVGQRSARRRDMSIGRFYAMVGALVRRSSDGRYLVLRRSEDKDFAGGEWECVTGRVDQGESFSDAVHREVDEELGVEVQIEFIVGTVHFYRGEATPENEIVGVQCCCSVENPAAIRQSWEHAEHRWITPQEAEALFPGTHWLGEIIRRKGLRYSRRRDG
jgi:8-oxo-dGTP diphosphatase